MDFAIYGIFGQTYGGNQAKFGKIVSGLYEGGQKVCIAHLNFGI